MEGGFKCGLTKQWNHRHGDGHPKCRCDACRVAIRYDGMGWSHVPCDCNHRSTMVNHFIGPVVPNKNHRIGFVESLPCDSHANAAWKPTVFRQSHKIRISKPYSSDTATIIYHPCANACCCAKVSAFVGICIYAILCQQLSDFIIWRHKKMDMSQYFFEADT